MKRTIHNSVAWCFLNWTLDNVSELVDAYADEMREPLNDAETDFRVYTEQEVKDKFRKAQLDVNMMRRLVCMAQKVITQMQNGTLSLDKAKELSGVIPPWEDDAEEISSDETDERTS